MAPTYKLITATTLSNSSTTSVSFTSIPSTYQHLVLKVQAKSSNQIAADGYITTNVTVNGASSNYYIRGWYTSGTTTLSNYGASGALGQWSANPSIPNDYTPSQPGRGYFDLTIPNYRTSGRMILMWKGGFTQRIGGGPYTYLPRNFHLYDMINSTGPLTDLVMSVSNAWLSGSSFRLYGLTNS